VDGALAGERVLARVVTRKKSFLRAETVEVLEAAPGRIAPRCPEIGRGCGGCDFAVADLATQHGAKRELITDTFTRVGKVADMPKVTVHDLPLRLGYRTTIRAGVAAGRAGFRRSKSHDLVAVNECGISHPDLVELLVEGRFGDATEVTLRLAAGSGERMVMTDGDPATVHVPEGVIVTRSDGPPRSSVASDPCSLEETIDGFRYRVSAGSFFQTRPDGAAALIERARAAVGQPGTLGDVCCGVGLFSVAIAADRVAAVEANPIAVADARVNLERAALGAGDASDGEAKRDVQVTCGRIEQWNGPRCDAVIADPSRAGLGAAGVESVAATEANTVVLISCDVAAGARDVGLFMQGGYHLESVELVDLFPDTSHLEVVSVLRK
jgi:23S rRNA (uracil1939-C5)-methyltransferase